MEPSTKHYLIGVLLGAVAIRAWEASCNGVSLAVAFTPKNLLTPVCKLKKCGCAGGTEKSKPYDPQAQAMGAASLGLAIRAGDLCR
jgi:hypothetical protein